MIFHPEQESYLVDFGEQRADVEGDVKLIDSVMFCPKCSQEQISDNIRYCSRCGFPLNIVVELLAHDGTLAREMKDKQQQWLSRRQRGAHQGKVLMLTSLAVTLISALFSIFLKPELFIPLTGIILLLCGVLRIFFAYVLERDERMQKPGAEPAQLSAADRDYLSPAMSVSATGFGKRDVNTAELVAPPSVIEHTTKLLKEN